MFSLVSNLGNQHVHRSVIFVSYVSIHFPISVSHFYFPVCHLLMLAVSYRAILDHVIFYEFHQIGSLNFRHKFSHFDYIIFIGFAPIYSHKHPTWVISFFTESYTYTGAAPAAARRSAAQFEMQNRLSFNTNILLPILML